MTNTTLVTVVRDKCVLPDHLFCYYSVYWSNNILILECYAGRYLSIKCTNTNVVLYMGKTFSSSSLEMGITFILPMARRLKATLISSLLYRWVWAGGVWHTKWLTALYRDWDIWRQFMETIWWMLSLTLTACQWFCDRNFSWTSSNLYHW